MKRPSQLSDPAHLKRSLAYAAARLGGILGRSSAKQRPTIPGPAEALPPGTSVVIPTRSGKTLLQRLLPLVEGEVTEVIVVDNGSDDGSADWVRSAFPRVRIEHSPEPLSFARAANRGIAAARFSKVCLLNNDMVPEPGFFRALERSFLGQPDLFCSTAQIFFPPGKRREETGKAVMRPSAPVRSTTEFPVYCAEPLPGEDGTYVLYGSGGCSLYDTAKLRMLGGVDEAYEPAYVEDLDLGVRGWQRGWPSVFAARAVTLHDHRTTTSRYFTEEELERILERNYLLFLARTIHSPELFRAMWRDAVKRLYLRAAKEHSRSADDVLAFAWRISRSGAAASATEDERLLFALTSGDVAVFPGRVSRTRQTTLVAASSLLMQHTAGEHDYILIAFVDELQTPPDEVLDACVEIVEVRRSGHALAFGAALRQTVRKWIPATVQLEEGLSPIEHAVRIKS